MNLIYLISKKIDGVKVELTVDADLSDKVMGGQPVLQIGRDCCMVYAVDSLKMIKAIHNAESLSDLNESIVDVWNSHSTDRKSVV